MKQALLFAFLLALLGIGGFLYRNALEAPTHNTNQNPGAVVCQLDAKVCPDGSSVGRTGPSCQFAACPLPNVEILEAGIGFAIPPLYQADENAYGADTTLLAAFTKTSNSASSTRPETIIVRRFPIPAGKDANSVMLAQTTYESSGMQPTSMSEFKPIIINGKTFQMIGVERFEALVHVEYYLPREHDVLRFEAIQPNVMNWTDPALNVRTLPAVAALEGMLATLQTK